MTDLMITSVWSSYGHRFISADGYQRCMTCGASYDLRADPHDPTSGDYVALDGSEPMTCTNRTDMQHGYIGERVDGWTDHNCNCLQCK